MRNVSLLSQYRDFVRDSIGAAFTNFEELHRWSVNEPDAFWGSLFEFDEISSPTPFTGVLADRSMPGATWFPGARVNYAAHVFRHVDRAEAAGQPAIIADDEQGPVATISWRELHRRVSSLALSLRELGLKPGDRVVALLPNRPEAIIAFLACASIGAIWSVCSPDMGVSAILGRFQQIEPKLLFAASEVRYAGRSLDLAPIVAELRESLPTLEAVILVGDDDADEPASLKFSDLIARKGAEISSFEPESVPFDHPLWIVYSSGTTGRPKALVHGHGGILLGAAAMRLHSDFGASYDPETLGERFHWYSSTGWIMWNLQVNGLLGGTTICIFDGSPVGSRDKPDLHILWRFVARNGVSFFGAGAQFFTTFARSELDLHHVGDLSRLHSLGSTGSTLPAATQERVSQMLADVAKADIFWFNTSGGTDIASAFCTGNRELPAAPGKLQCRQIGSPVEAWSAQGNAIVGDVGELVCTGPMPSMPLYFWGDQDGSRYRESYFETYPGVWRHGDWLRIDADGACEISGRSDATINRGGHRMGSSEIYAAVATVSEVAETLAVDIRTGDGDSQLLLFVVPADGHELSTANVEKIRGTIRTLLSPRFVPDHILRVDGIPQTLSGKKQELPIKRLFEGGNIENLIDPSAMANPDCLAAYVRLASEFGATA